MLKNYFVKMQVTSLSFVYVPKLKSNLTLFQSANGRTRIDGLGSGDDSGSICHEGSRTGSQGGGMFGKPLRFRRKLQKLGIFEELRLGNFSRAHHLWLGASGRGGHQRRVGRRQNSR